MLRFVVFSLIGVLLISVVRAIVGVVLKGFADLMGAGGNTQSAGNPVARPPDVPLGGDLKKDPVCGTFVATSTSVKKTVGGKVIHFCSTDCRDKYQA